MTGKISKSKKNSKKTQRSLSKAHHHTPDHSPLIKRLNKIAGQVSGIKRMIENKRYCPDILIQTRAACSAIKSLEATILETHLKHCVQMALNSKDEKDSTRKIEELLSIFKKNL